MQVLLRLAFETSQGTSNTLELTLRIGNDAVQHQYSSTSTCSRVPLLEVRPNKRSRQQEARGKMVKGYESSAIDSTNHDDVPSLVAVMGTSKRQAQAGKDDSMHTQQQQGKGTDSTGEGKRQEREAYPWMQYVPFSLPTCLPCVFTCGTTTYSPRPVAFYPSLPGGLTLPGPPFPFLSLWLCLRRRTAITGCFRLVRQASKDVPPPTARSLHCL